MNKEKQIKEMTVEFAKINCNPKGCYSCDLCDEYGSLELSCEDYLVYRKMAETFYNADYRKQDEDTVEVVRCKDCKFNVANMEKDPLDITDYSGDDIVCSYFMTDGLDPTDFCSYGAKMKGADDEQRED